MPYQRNDYFTGRDALLADLHTALATDKNAALTQAIHGLGGVGKTQTAVEYAYRYADEYTNVFWVRAENKNEIQQGYMQMARSLGLLAEQDNTPDRAVLVVKEWLQSPQHGGWLLVYDNADTPQLLKDYRPLRPKGTTLLTSRHHNFGALGIPHPFNVLAWDTPQAVAFLCKRVGRETDAMTEQEQQAAAQIAEMLGGLPLALEQAGAFICEQDMAFASYVIEYRRRAQELLESEPEMGDYRDGKTNAYRTVWTTWELNFKVVRAESQASAEVLTFSAFLAPDAVPAKLLLLGAEHVGAATAAHVEKEGLEWPAYDALLTPLTRYSLVEKDRDAYVYTMHRLVQQVLRDHLSAEEQQEQAKRVVQALYAAYPGKEFERWPRCERLLPHWRQGAAYIMDHAITSVEAGALLTQTGYYLNERGQYAEAEPLFGQALGIHKQAYSEQHPNVATNLNNLAGLYRAQGRYEDAEPLFVQALDIRQKALPQGHHQIATNLNNLAGLYRAQGRYEDAEPLFVQALDIDRVALGEQHPNYATYLNNLAGLYREQGRYKDAEPLYVQALGIRQKALPQGHPDIAQSLNNLAGLYKTQGRYQDAESLYVEALEIFERALGMQHPNTQGVRHNLELFRQEAVLRTRQQKGLREGVRSERPVKPPVTSSPPRQNLTPRRKRPPTEP